MRAIISTIGASLFFGAGRPAQDVVDVLGHKLAECSAQEACAETNSLSRLLREPGQDYLYFLHSDTAEGEYCAEALRRHYESQGYLAESRRIAQLKYDAAVFRTHGLKALVNEIADLIEHHHERAETVLINATGGFKAQIAYATLLGLLYRVEVDYIHEDFSDIIQLPLVPIGFDLLLWREHQERLHQVLSAPDLPTAYALRDRLPPEFDMLLQEQEGGLVLSPAGDAFYRAFTHNYHQVELQRREAIKTSGDHKSVWGIRHIRTLTDIPDKEVRILLARLLSFNFVRQVALGHWETQAAKQDTYLTFKEQKSSAVEYTLHCRAGTEQIMVVVQEGTEDLLVAMVGRKAYP